MGPNKRILFSFGLLSITLIVSGQFQISHLQCEYRTNPLGIDERSPRFSWRLEAENSTRQKAYRILVSSSKQGLMSNEGDLWDSGITLSSSTQNIIYGGKALEAFQKCFWKVLSWDEKNKPSNWSDVAIFTLGPLEDTDWPAEWIGPPASPHNTNFPILNKNFELEQIPEAACTYVNVLGYYELYVNGNKVSDDILSPSVADYSKHTLYTTYDITPFLKIGQNTISLWLAHGWNRLIEGNRYFGVVEGIPMVRAFARFEYPTGSIGIIPTDRSWKIRYSNRHYTGSWRWGDFGGERVDLNQESGLNGQDNTEDRPVHNYIVNKVPAIAQRNHPTRIIDSISPVNITELGNKECLVDFGKHLTGWVRFEFNGLNADTAVTLEYIDKLLKLDAITDGIEKRFAKQLSNKSKNRGYISYNQHDILIPAGKEKESFRNKFNYHAYRWIKLSGINRKEISSIIALQISENNEQIAAFNSSNGTLNAIWDATVNTYRCLNYSGYVVDCPHRERLGYGGDSHASLETGLSIFDISPLCIKWTRDWNESMYPTGLWPHTAPHMPQHKNKFSPGWGGFGMFLPWQFYNYYGDTLILKQAYPYIKKWMKFLETNTENGILKRDSLEGSGGFGAFHGDWVAPYYGMGRATRVDQNSTNFFNNCFYLYELEMAQSIAEVLGEYEDAAYYSKRHETVKPAIHQQFYDYSNNWYTNGEQPYQAFPLLVDLVPDTLRPEIDDLLEYLILEKNDGHLNTGMLGTYFLLEYLMKADKGDLIYTMVNQKAFPGWGYMVENGATTLWEQWNGNNSQIHNCYLSIGKWFVRGLGGIQFKMEKPGQPIIILDPDYIHDLDFVDVSCNTRHGKIISSWKRESDTLVHYIEIPVNVRTSYKIPQKGDPEISVDGVIIDKNQQNLIQLGPGKHIIRVAE